MHRFSLVAAATLALSMPVAAARAEGEAPAPIETAIAKTAQLNVTVTGATPFEAKLATKEGIDHILAHLREKGVLALVDRAVATSAGGKAYGVNVELGDPELSLGFFDASAKLIFQFSVHRLKSGEGAPHARFRFPEAGAKGGEFTLLLSPLMQKELPDVCRKAQEAEAKAKEAPKGGEASQGTEPGAKDGSTAPKAAPESPAKSTPPAPQGPVGPSAPPAKGKG